MFFRGLVRGGGVALRIRSGYHKGKSVVSRCLAVYNKTMFKSLLVANRGEIACRVIRACKELGITPYTVYSDIDANSPHVALVGPSNAFHIGGNPAQQSYLKADRIVQVARENGIEAIHPGYGFLSENEDFARLCAEANITFVGPTPEVIHLMGDKLAARVTAKAAWRTGRPRHLPTSAQLRRST